jgi:hypothetical protein
MGFFILIPFLTSRSPNVKIFPSLPQSLLIYLFFLIKPHLLDVKFSLPSQISSPPPIPRRSPPAPIQFPVEIIFHILELAYLNNHNITRDYSLLLASALVCHRWSTPAQKLLFRHVNLSTQISYSAFVRAVNRSSVRGRMLGDSVIHLRAVLDSNQPYGLSLSSFTHAVSLCPRLSELNLSLYGSGVPGVRSPNHSRIHRISPSLDAVTLSYLKFGPSISVLRFNNWSDDGQSLFHLLDLWPSLKSLSLSGTPPIIPSSTSINPPSCVLQNLSLNFQSSPSVQFLKWLLHNSSFALRALEFVRDPSLDVLEHLLVHSKFPLHSLSLPACNSPDRISMIQNCTHLNELITESPCTSPTLYRSLSKSIHHLALAIDKNSTIQPLIDLIKSSHNLTTISIHLWTGGEHHPRLSAVKIACAMQGIDLRLTRDIQLFRTMLVRHTNFHSFLLSSYLYPLFLHKS